MKQGLQARLLASLIFLVCVTLALMAYALFENANGRLEYFQLHQAVSQARSLAQGSLDALVTRDYELLERWVASAMPSESYAYSGLVKQNGQVLTHTDLVLIGRYVETANTPNNPVTRQTIYNNRPVMEIIYPAMLGEVYLANAHLAYYLDEEVPITDKSISRMVIALLAGLAVLIVGSYLITRRVITPINYLTRIVSTVAPDKKIVLDSQVLNSNDEVGELARTFESMSSRLIMRLEELTHSKNKLAEEVEARTHAQEELILAHDAAVAANETKSQFLANMSHELRTPLNAVIGYGEIILDDIRECDDKRYEKEVRSIVTAGKHLLQIINDILNVAAIEAGKIHLHFEEVSIPGMINEVIATIRPLADKNNNALEVSVAEHISTMVSDYTRVKQVLYNLLGNACKFTDHGTITLNVFGAKDPAGNDETIIFEVTDTGIGISQDKLGNIFDAFSQADGSHTRKYGGSGLGLTISKHFCQAMGGSITVESQERKGSTFRAILPAHAPQPAAHEPARDKPHKMNVVSLIKGVIERR